MKKTARSRTKKWMMAAKTKIRIVLLVVENQVHCYPNRDEDTSFM